MEALKTGTRVKIIHSGQIYANYRKMADELGLTKWKYDHSTRPFEDKEGIIIGSRPHEYLGHGEVYGVYIEDCDTDIMISRKGLEVISGDNTIPNCKFNIGDYAEITDTGRIYKMSGANYLRELNISNWITGRIDPPLRMKVTIIGLCRHHTMSNIILAGVRSAEGIDYVINIEGLYKVESAKSAIVEPEQVEETSQRKNNLLIASKDLSKYL